MSENIADLKKRLDTAKRIQAKYKEVYAGPGADDDLVASQDYQNLCKQIAKDEAALRDARLEVQRAAAALVSDARAGTAKALGSEVRTLLDGLAPPPCLAVDAPPAKLDLDLIRREPQALAKGAPPHFTGPNTKKNRDAFGARYPQFFTDLANPLFDGHVKYGLEDLPTWRSLQACHTGLSATQALTKQLTEDHALMTFMAAELGKATSYKKFSDVAREAAKLPPHATRLDLSALLLALNDRRQGDGLPRVWLRVAIGSEVEGAGRADYLTDGDKRKPVLAA